MKIIFSISLLFRLAIMAYLICIIIDVFNMGPHFTFDALYPLIVWLLKVSKQTRQKQSSSSDIFSLPLAVFVIFPFPFPFVDINFLRFSVWGCKTVFLTLFFCCYSSSIASFSEVSINIAVLRFLWLLFVTVLGLTCGVTLNVCEELPRCSPQAPDRGVLDLWSEIELFKRESDLAQNRSRKC